MNWPDIVKYKVFYYLWKLRIKAVNNQYLAKYFIDNYTGILNYNVYNKPFGRLVGSYLINFRIRPQAQYNSDFIYNINDGYCDKTYITIPNCYYFSSGFNNLNGYKY